MQDNNDVIEQLKKKAEADAKAKPDRKLNTQTTKSSVSSDDDIKALLKKQYLKGNEDSILSMSEDYAFDTVDFGVVDEEYITGEIKKTEPAEKETVNKTDTEVTEAENDNIYIEDHTDNSDGNDEQDGSDEYVLSDEEPTDEELTDDESADDELEKTDAIAAAVDEAVLENDEELDEITEEVISGRSDNFLENDDEADDADTEAAEKLEEAEENNETDSDELSETSDDASEAIEEESEDNGDDAAEAKFESQAYGSNIGAWDEDEQDAAVPAPIYISTAMDDGNDTEPELEYEAIGEESVAFGDPDESENENDSRTEPEKEDTAVSDEDAVDYGNMLMGSVRDEDILEGQQGTVFNEFVEDLSGDLEDVVPVPEITESRPPEKQCTILDDRSNDEQKINEKLKNFEYWEELARNTDEASASTMNGETRHVASPQKVSGNTDYFNTVSISELDATDIALMVALGGEKELNQTVGFEKIRQAVHDSSKEDEKTLRGKEIYGCLGDEYTSLAQNAAIKKKYRKDRTRLIVQLSLTALLTLVLIMYEITGWIGLRLGGIFNLDTNPEIYVLAGLQLLFFCAALSYNRFIRLFKNIANLSTTAFIGALLILLVNIPHDVLILALGYAAPGVTFHSISAFLMLLSLIYDLFELSEQANAFNVISNNEKKLILEPYGKLRVSEEYAGADIIDKDSYRVSRVNTLTNFFKRVSRSSPANSARLVSLVLSITVSLCVMLVLLLMGESLATIVLGFVISFSFTLLCSAVFETEFAFFIVHRILKKHKTGIIGKASVSEYSKCNIVYFDDFNVFSKKSVKTKGLKVYNNGEIYRVLYYTQAVFTKVGGPLKSVFEFATTEMTRSKDVEITDLSKEGIGATVNGRTRVLIGTGAYMKSKGISPSYAPLDMRAEERGEEGIMFISLNGTLSAKLYVTYQFSSEFEKLARKLNSRGVKIGIRSCDPNVNDHWAKRYSKMKKMDISTVRPTVNEIESPSAKTIEGGVVSAKNVRMLIEALMLCIRLDSFESLISKLRTVFVVLTGILAFALVLLSGINTVSMLALTLEMAFCASLMMLLTHFYIKH